METTRVGIIGYYGNSYMTYETYMLIVKECEEIIQKDFGLDITQCTFISNGGSWMNHIPVTLALKHSKQIKFILPAPWSISKKSFYEETHETSLPVIMTHSHILMRNKLKNKIDSLEEIQQFMVAGFEVINEYDFRSRELKFIDELDYLIFIPIEKNYNDSDGKYGKNIFLNFQKPKRVISIQAFNE